MNPTIALLASYMEIKIRLTARAGSEAKAVRIIMGTEIEIRKRLKDYIFGVDEETMEEAVARRLLRKKLTIATAESCTGGLLAHRLTNIPGSSDYFMRGFIVYSNKAKEELLKVPKAMLVKYGAVSRQVAEKMAENVRKLSKTDIGVGITGIAGPGGATPSKPVGLVYIAVSTRKRTICTEFRSAGSRAAIKERSSQSALNMLRGSGLVF